MDRQNWFNGLGKGGVRLERKKVVTFRSDEGTNAHAVGRRIDDKVDGIIVDQMLWRLEYQLHDGDTKVSRQNNLPDVSPVRMDLEQKDWCQ